MAGEYQIAQKLFANTIDEANNNQNMQADIMARALLNEVLGYMLVHQSAKDLEGLIQYELESLGASDFVITRGC